MARSRIVKPTDEEVHRYSFTQISTYLNCGRKYRFNYIDRIPKVGVNVWMILGKKLHEYVEEVLIARLCKKDLSANDRLEVLHEIADAMREEIDDKIREYHVYLEEQAGCIVNLHTDFDPDLVEDQFLRLGEQWDKDALPEIDPIAVEQKIELEIGGVPFIMFIDLIQNTERGKQILDWKCTKKAKGKAAADNSLQLSLYALATDTRNVAFGSLVRPMEGKEKTWKPRVQIDTSTRSGGDLEWAAEIVASAAQSIEAGIFPLCSTENFLCNENFCDFWGMCRGQHTTPDVDKPSWFNE